jgi:hypothetical protein
MARTADTAKTATAHQRAGILLLLPRANEAPLLGRSLLPNSRNGRARAIPRVRSLVQRATRAVREHASLCGLGPQERRTTAR